MRLRGNVSSVHRFLEQQEALEEEKSQCDAITTLLDVDPWNKQSVRDVLYFQGDTLTPDRSTLRIIIIIKSSSSSY